MEINVNKYIIGSGQEKINPESGLPAFADDPEGEVETSSRKRDCKEWKEEYDDKTEKLAGVLKIDPDLKNPHYLDFATKLRARIKELDNLMTSGSCSKYS